MTSPVYRKTRTLVDGVSVTETINLPTFPAAGSRSDPLVFAGAMGGAKIGAARLTVASFTDLTSIDAKLQDSADGVTWEDVDATNLAFTQATGNTTERLDVPDDTHFRRFVRVAFEVAGTGSATCTVELDYMQCGPRDLMSPPGLPARDQ